MGDNGRGMVGIALALVVVLAPAMRAPAFEASVKTLESRPGVTESFLLVRPEGPPVASVILLSGGNGVVSLNRFGPRWTHGNFLVRSRAISSPEKGFLVAVLDVPSDRGPGYGRFRVS